VALPQQSDISIEIHHRYCHSSPRSGAGKGQKRFMSSNCAPATSLFRVTGRLFCATFSYAAKTGKEE
jgi:hypothetical protein